MCVVSGHQAGGDLSQPLQEMRASVLLDGLGSLSEPCFGRCKLGSHQGAFMQNVHIVGGI